MEMFFTIRADVQESTINKKYRDLIQVVANINDDLATIFKNDSSTLIKLNIRKGDELFAIYRDLNIALEALQLLLTEAKAYKVPLYIGCGYGEIEDVSDDENLVNGLSIWRASEALKDIKRARPKYNEKLSDNILLKVIVSNDDDKNDKYQTLFYLLAEKVLKRTTQQNTAVKLLKKYPQKTLNELYNLLEGLNEEDNSKIIEDKKIKYIKYIQRADYYIVKDIVEIIKNDMNKEEV